MKKYAILMLFFLTAMMGMSQTMNVYWGHNRPIYPFHIWRDNITEVKFKTYTLEIYSGGEDPYMGFNHEDIQYVTFSSKEEAPIRFVPEEAYVSTDFSKDGQIAVLQKHQQGKGIPLVILGDAFSDRMINLGLFDYYAQHTMNVFFAKEPFTTFRDYFDVYAVTAVSLKEVACKETAFGYGMDNSITEDGEQRLYNYVLSIPELNNSVKNVTAIMVRNLPSDYPSDYSTSCYAGNFNVGQTYFTMNNEYERFNNYLVWHEAGGHAFGLLADERVNNNATDVFPEESRQWLDEAHAEGSQMNIDYHDTPETILWKDFISNPDYEVEQIGLYEGALYSYGKGIYKPSDTSIMFSSDVKDYYNAPSRWAIYQRIMKLAGEECKFENFLEYDKKNLEMIKSLNAGVDSPDKTVGVTSVSINPTKADITVGKTLQLSATVTPRDATNKTVSWFSSSTAIASVSSSGIVTAVAEGDVTITARAGDKSATCEIKVVPNSTSGEQHVPDNEIWYTTTDGKIFNPNYKEELVSNTYSDGIGKMVFKNKLYKVTYDYISDDSRERIETIKLPESVTKIGIVTFAACPNLKAVDMPGVKTIEREAFSQSGILGTLDLPETLEEIGDFAFFYCRGLTEITIPKNVKKIGEGAFLDGGYTKAILKPLSPPVMEGNYTLDTRDLLYNRKCLIYVPEESLEAYQTADNWKKCTGFMTVEGKMPQDCWYISTDYSHDGEVVVLQQATVGKGINLIFLGDGYVDRDLGPGGKYEELAKLEMENLFGYEPFKSFRDRFNVYLINCVSKNDVYFTPFGHAERLFTYDDDRYRYFGTYEDRCEQYARKVVPSTDEPIFATILMNKDYDGEASFCSPYFRDPGYMAFAFVSNRRNEGDDATFPHEMGGHGFGLLADEYIGVGSTFAEDQRADLDDFLQRTGYGINVDWRNNPAEVRWKHFLNDPRYSEEGLGVWEGAYVFEFGIYRPSEESIMNGCGDHGSALIHPNWFNAPSREQIYKQIMKYSEGPDWQYDYEKFVEIDAPGRQQAAERYKNFLLYYNVWAREQNRSSSNATRAELYSRKPVTNRLPPVFR